MLQIRNLNKSFGTNLLFDSVSFSMIKGERLALIGRNGSGKSTLFRMILGEEHPDDGQITMPGNYRCGHLAQRIHFTQPSIIQEVCHGISGEDSPVEFRAEMILAGLGFSRSDMCEDPFRFSGGFQLRICLAKVLLSAPDLLLLDEPTNYLDIVSLRWLERFLRQWKDELIVISHDRIFLDSVCSHSMLIHRKKVKKLSGSCLKVIEQVRRDEEIHEKTRENLNRKKENLEVFINRFRAKASKASSVQSRIKAVERLDIRDELQDEDIPAFFFTRAPFHGKILLEADSLSFSYPGEPLKGDRPLIHDISLTIGRRDRIGVIGKNGKGKSTLLRLLCGELVADPDTVRIHEHARTGYFGQTNVDTLSPHLSIEDEVQSSNPELSRTEVRTICGTMMFGGDSALKKISVLSGGERSRVVLAKIMAMPTNLLLLDEPTSHLDVESVEALIESLRTYEGAIVVVSHDEALLRSLTERIIVFEQSGQQLVEGGYEYFLDKIGWENEVPQEPSCSPDEKISELSRKARKERGRIVHERSRRLFPIQKAIEDTESAICSLEREMAECNEGLVQASEQTLISDIERYSRRIVEIQQEIENFFGKLEKLHADMERIRAEFETPSES